jgi:hypothetical protein
MRTGILLLLGIAALAGVYCYGTHTSTGKAQFEASGSATSPVLVELFTSEGCSSCPPADRLLARIHQEYPSAIVLSEHVSYWNYLGWQDPYSSDAATARQNDYVNRMNLSGSYTPQMVVNGQYEFVGSDASAAAAAIQKASNQATVRIALSNLKVTGDQLGFNVETDKTPQKAQLVMALVQDEGIQHVKDGENSGHTLKHVQVARLIRQIADLKSGAEYKATLTSKLPQEFAGSAWHLTLFLQEGRGGAILGAASQPIQ